MAEVTRLVSNKAELGASPASERCPFFLLKQDLPTLLTSVCSPRLLRPETSSLSTSKQAAQLAGLALALAHPAF